MNSTSGFARESGPISRAYETEADLRDMQDLLMEVRLRQGDWRCWHVGELMWAFFMVTCHLNPHEHVRQWHDSDGRLIGYAILGEDPSIDWQVLPEYEETAVESEMVDWAEMRLADLRQRGPERWGGRIVSGGRQDDARRIAFLEARGFQRGEYIEVNMIRPLDAPIPEPSLPAGCQVCAFAGPEQVTNRAGAEREVWAAWPVGKVTDEDYLRLMGLPGYDRDLDIVAVAPDGVIAAYANAWLDPVNRIGDFGPVGARQAYRRQGFTRAVLLEGLRRMQARGMNRACVSTGEANEPARRLYESVGFEIVNRYVEYVKDM